MWQCTSAQCCMSKSYTILDAWVAVNWHSAWQPTAERISTENILYVCMYGVVFLSYSQGQSSYSEEYIYSKTILQLQSHSIVYTHCRRLTDTFIVASLALYDLLHLSQAP